MSLPSDFVSSLCYLHPREVIELIDKNRGARDQQLLTWELRNELRPVDLYCYLGGRFGPPNGIQNFLRADDSDNLIHWEWTLRHATGLVTFQGMNFRSEIHILGVGSWLESDREVLIEQIRNDFAAHGAAMGKMRSALEHWVEFVNPYQRIRRAFEKLLKDLEALELQPAKEIAEQPWDIRGAAASREAWKATADRYSKGLGLCFGIRSMLPVLAEAFVNLVLYILMRPEMKEDDRLRENAFRQPIDVRIKSLSINCRGFKTQPDYASDACKRYHSLVNERNDLLHGNVVVDKLKFNEVYFLGKVPVFREYRSLWERSLGVEMKSVGLEALKDEVRVVEDLVNYILSCVVDDLRDELRTFTERYELALNTKNRHLGVLFPEHLVDFHAGPARAESASTARPEAAQQGVAPDGQAPAAPARR